MKPLVTLERLHNLLSYDKETGIFRWKGGSGRGGQKSGDIAGCLHEHYGSKKQGSHKPRPLVLIGLDYRLYRAHRLAWFYVHGEWPKVIDHINGDPSDNRLCNLSATTCRINSQNMRKAQSHNKLGLLGVCWDKARSKFKSEIRLPSGRKKFLGRFDTAEQAHEAYIQAKRQYHEGCTI